MEKGSPEPSFKSLFSIFIKSMSEKREKANYTSGWYLSKRKSKNLQQLLSKPRIWGNLWIKSLEELLQISRKKNMGKLLESHSWNPRRDKPEGTLVNFEWISGRIVLTNSASIPEKPLLEIPEDTVSRAEILGGTLKGIQGATLRHFGVNSRSNI